MEEEKEVSGEDTHAVCYSPCPECNKKGTLDNGETCPSCGGTGCKDKKACAPSGGLDCKT